MEMLENILDVFSTGIFMGAGAWGTAYGYGWVDIRILGKFSWNPQLQRQLRWLGPLLFLLCVMEVILYWKFRT